MKTVAIITARMGSKRLPGKVLSDLGGMSVLEWVLAAARNARGVDEVWVATSDEPADDLVEECTLANDAMCYRGSEDDVLQRFAGAALQAEADIVIRLTGDCPLLDPTVIGEVIRLRQTLNVDYASNIYPPTWPDGLDTEVFTASSLFVADIEATRKIDRECVTTFITNNQKRFTTANLTCPIPGLHKSRWVLDNVDDQKFIRALVEIIDINFQLDGPVTYLQILEILDRHPDLTKINHHHPRNERLYEALATEPLPRRYYGASKSLLRRAEKTIPLGAQTFSKSKIQYPSDSPLFVTHGDGGYVWDVDGNRYVDLVGGLLPNILGYRDCDVDDAIRRQLDRGISFSLATELEAELSELLCRLIPCAEMARFGKNGTDATSAAVRLARAFTGRDSIVSSGYHGWADWAIACDPLRNNGVPLGYLTVPLKHGDIKSLWNLQDRRHIAAVIVEPETDPSFLASCRAFCDQTGALLIFDEIITGFRFDLGGAQKLYGITPDLACFGKCMANGMPISALVGKRHIMEEMVKTSFSGTFFGEALSLAASIATIKKLEQEDVLSKIALRQKELLCLLPAIKVDGPLLTFHGHLGGLPRIKFMSDDIKTLFIQEMAQNGVLLIASHNLCYAHGKNEIDRVVTAYEKTIRTILEGKTGFIGEAISPQANLRSA